MAEIIKDGTGSGNTARVDPENRLSVKALILPEDLEAGLLGCAFDISSTLITLTNDTANSLVYIKNNECGDLVLSAVFADFGSSTCGVGTGIITQNINPTAGTLVCCTPTCAQVLNRKIGASCTLTADIYRADANSQTLTGGSTIQFPQSAGTNAFFASPFILPKGASFGFGYQPPAGNTSMVVQIGFLILKGVTNGN